MQTSSNEHLPDIGDDESQNATSTERSNLEVTGDPDGMDGKEELAAKKKERGGRNSRGKRNPSGLPDQNHQRRQERLATE